MNSIRILGVEDYEALYELIESNRDRLIRYFPITCSNCKTLEKSWQYLEKLTLVEGKKEVYPVGIFNKEQLVGMMYVKSFDWKVQKCEIGYFIDKNQQRMGIVTTALKDTVDYCFKTHDLNKVFLRIGEDNIGSRKVAEKNGFKQEGVLREEFKIETSELVNIVYYGLLKKDFYSM